MLQENENKWSLSLLIECVWVEYFLSATEGRNMFSRRTIPKNSISMKIVSQIRLNPNLIDFVAKY